MPELSLVITVLNEEENIAPLLASVRAALSGLDYEVILVDDGSTDQTKKRILEEADDRTCLVELRKNFGQSNAMMAGIDHSSGSYIVLLDGDLQNDPLDIPAMLDLLKQGEWDMVAGNRKNRFSYTFCHDFNACRMIQQCTQEPPRVTRQAIPYPCRHGEVIAPNAPIIPENT